MQTRWIASPLNIYRLITDLDPALFHKTLDSKLRIKTALCTPLINTTFRPEINSVLLWYWIQHPHGIKLRADTVLINCNNDTLG